MIGYYVRRILNPFGKLENTVRIREYPEYTEYSVYDANDEEILTMKF